MVDVQETCRLLTNLKAYCRRFINFDSIDPLYFESSLTKGMPKDDALESDDDKFEIEETISSGQHNGARHKMKIRKRGSHHSRVSEPFAEPGQIECGVLTFTVFVALNVTLCGFGSNKVQ